MRQWRKLYSTILDSQQVAALSDGSVVMLAFLIAAQDDSGYYPWSAAKVRRLIASRPLWTAEDAEVFAGEIVDAGIAAWEDGGITLVKGAALNGNPRSGRQSDLFPRQPSGDQAATTSPPDGNQMAALEQSRVEQSRVEQMAGDQAATTSPPDGNQQTDAGQAAAFTAYQQNISISLNPAVASSILDWLMVVPAAWVVEACRRAAVQNKRSWAYVEGMLRPWLEKGGPDAESGRHSGKDGAGAAGAVSGGGYDSTSIRFGD